MTQPSYFHIRRLISQRAFSTAEAACQKRLREIENDHDGDNDRNNELYSLYFVALYQQRKFSEIIKAFDQVEHPTDYLLSMYANALRYSNLSIKAVEALSHHLHYRPDNFHLFNQLGLIYKELGEKSNAENAFYQALKINSQFAEAYWHLAGISPALPQAQCQQLAKIAAENSSSDADKIHACFALFKYYDHKKQYSRAFSYLNRGSALKRANLDYDHLAHCQEFSNNRRFFDQLQIDRLTALTKESLQAAPLNSVKPIFILGMPRSGTTLVEQILASHPLVTGGDESQHLLLATQQCFSAQQQFTPQGQNTAFRDFFSTITPRQIQQLRQNYFNLSASGGASFTDKTLLNFKVVGVIASLFPEAKIIHCYRDPMDNIMSCFKQLFDGGLEFTYHLDELADIFIAYKKLMDHWQKLSRCDFYSLAYEKLVTEPEKETRRLLEYLELPFAEQCLQFYQNERAVHTLSSLQVKQPIHAKAIGHWKNYQSFLTRFENKLNRAHTD